MKNHPLIEDYAGGGAILNSGTTAANVIRSCSGLPELTIEVSQLISDGNEVVVQSGRICAVSPVTRIEKGRVPE